MSDPAALPDDFLAQLSASVRDGTFVKLTLGKPRGPDATLRNLFVRPVMLRGAPQLSFLWRHETQDITKNFPPEDALAQIAPNPIVELNRAVAVSMAFGPALGLEIIDSIAAEPALAKYYLLPSVRGDFLFKLQRFAEATIEFKRAASLTENVRERTLLLDRAARSYERSVSGP